MLAVLKAKNHAEAVVVIRFGFHSGGLARAQPFDFDMACGMGLIQSEVFDLDARERAFAVATGIYADATAVDVDAEAARTPVFGQVMCRRVAKETELAFIAP